MDVQRQPLVASPLAVVAPFVDRPFVQKQWQKALSEVDSDPEGAISTARALVETVCKHLLEELGIEFKDDGDLAALFKATVAILNLAPSTKASNCLKQMMGGAFSVMNGLAGLRNEFGDAHGKAKGYVGPEPRHARFAVNSAGGLAMFMLETHEERPNRPDEAVAPVLLAGVLYPASQEVPR